MLKDIQNEISTTRLVTPTLALLSEFDKPKVIAFIGDTGKGKSYLIGKVIETKKWPTIVIDKNHQDTWRDISVTVKNTQKLKEWNRDKGIFRLKGTKVVAEMRDVMEHYTETQNTLKRICLIMEDCGEYVQTLKETSNLMGLTGAVRHANCHIFLIFHSIDQIPLKLKAHLQAIVLFKTKDDEDYFRLNRRFRRQAYLRECFEELNKASTPKHTHYVIDLD